MVLVTRYLFFRGFVGLTLWPLIILKHDQLKADSVLLNHERIHLRQQLELFVLPFFLWYLVEWFIGLVKYRNSYLAYQNISFEREAYTHDTDLSYLKHRRPWRFLRYLRSNADP